MNSYVLRSLKLRDGEAPAVEESEFRLLCSGVLYNGSVQTTDWTKSDASRLLMTEPVQLTVVSERVDEYPQELLLSIQVPQVTEEHGSGADGPRLTTVFFPHREVAADVASLLTLLVRRLVTVHSQTRVTFISPRPVSGEVREVGLPIAKVAQPPVWKMRPSVLTYGADGLMDIRNYAPPPVALDPSTLARVLGGLPGSEDAEALLASARLYSQAMQLIEDRPDVAYLLFIAALETIAGRLYATWCPTAEMMKKAKLSVFEKAVELGLKASEAQDLAALACAGMTWSRRKINLFLADFVSDQLWTQDDLFHISEGLTPEPADFDAAISRILQARGAALHSGNAYPDYVGAGSGPTVPASALHAVLADETTLPPVTWFERVVNLSIVNWLEASITTRGGS